MLERLKYVAPFRNFLDRLVTLRKKTLLGGRVRKNNFIFVFFISGFFGFLFGVFYATHQDVIKTAQIISGVVHYPPSTLWLSIICSTWSVLNQICAIFLLLGVSELTLCYLVSGLLGMLSFQALSLTVLALSQACFLSIATPFLMLLTGAYIYSLNYPVAFIFPSTYGVLGLSYTLLLIAVISNKRYNLAGFLLGITPSIHMTYGLFLCLAVAISLLCDFKALRSYFSNAVKYFLLGGLVCIVSLFFHLPTSPAMPQVSNEVASYYLKTFIEAGWDAHRRPIDFTSVGMFLNIAGFGISLLWLKFFRRELPENIRFLLRSFLVFAALGIGFGALTWLPIEQVPNIIISMMPQRILNFNIFGFFALLIGLFGYHKNRLLMQFGLIVLIAILVLLILGFLPRSFLFVAMFGGSIALIVLKSVTMLKEDFPPEKSWIPNITRGATICLLIFSIGLSIIKVYPPAFKYIKYRIPDRTRSIEGRGNNLNPSDRDGVGTGSDYDETTDTLRP